MSQDLPFNPYQDCLNQMDTDQITRGWKIAQAFQITLSSLCLIAGFFTLFLLWQKARYFIVILIICLELLTSACDLTLNLLHFTGCTTLGALTTFYLMSVGYTSDFVLAFTYLRFAVVQDKKGNPLQSARIVTSV